MQFLNQDIIDLNIIDEMDKRVVMIIPPENHQLLILFRNKVKDKLKEEGLLLEDLFRIYSIKSENGVSPICMDIIKYIKGVGFFKTYGHEIIYDFKNCWKLKNYCGFVVSSYEIDDIKRVINWIIKQYEGFKQTEETTPFFNMIVL